MKDLHTTITRAFRYLETNSIEIPADLLIQARQKGITVKASKDRDEIITAYRAAILFALAQYFEGYAIVARNQFNTATVTAFTDMAEQGWQDGGEELPLDEEAQAWFDARLAAELAFIALLFIQLGQLKEEPEFDAMAWMTARADGYINTLRGVYNNAHLRAMADVMVTFEGDDGAESCDTCQMLKGQRHKVSWFVRREYVPPFGAGLDCHPGGKCRHGLKDDKGRVLTI